MANRPIGEYNDTFIRLQRELTALRREVAAMRTQQNRFTFPIYSPGVLAEMEFNDGEVYIKDANDKAYFWSAGVERVITSAP